MSARSIQKASAIAPQLPQVNLLPPEVRAARALQPVKRWLGISVLIAIAVVGIAFFLGTLERSNAEAALDRANQETAALLTEQRKYAEVPVVTNALQKSRVSRVVAMSTEVLWADYVGAIEAVIPEGVSIDTLAVNVVAPDSQGLLETPALARVTFVTRSLAPPVIAEWVRTLNGIPGFSDARVTAVDIDGDDKAPSSSDSDSEDAASDDATAGRYYVSTTTVLVTADALSHRFTNEGAQDDAE